MASDSETKWNLKNIYLLTDKKKQHQDSFCSQGGFDYVLSRGLAQKYGNIIDIIARVGHPFFSKERSNLCILFRSL